MPRKNLNGTNWGECRAMSVRLGWEDKSALGTLRRGWPETAQEGDGALIRRALREAAARIPPPPPAEPKPKARRKGKPRPEGPPEGPPG